MCRWIYWWLKVCSVTLVLVTMPPKGGIRKRIASTSPDRPSSSTGAVGSEPSPPRGGVRQRIAHRLESTIAYPLPLNDTLKKQWTKGKLSSPQVQQIAESAMQQGATGADRLAAAGAHGQHPQNLQRSFVSFFGMPKGAPEFVWHKIPLKSGMVSHPFLLPHMFFQALHSEHKEAWDKSIRGPAGSAATFWEAMGGSDFVQKHPTSHQNADITLSPPGFMGMAGLSPSRTASSPLAGIPCSVKAAQ